MTPAIPLTDAMRDDQLFGPVFNKESFWPWFTVAKLIDGLPLDARELDLFQRCTGRNRPPSGPARRLILLAGRRAGKDRFLSAVGCWRATLCADWSALMSAGETATVSLLGADRRQARIMRRYAEGLLAAPMLAPMVARVTDEAIEFQNGAALEIMTNDARLVRGRSAIGVLGSESCYWRDEDSASSDAEVVGAAEPSLAMCPDGGVLILGSSVYRKRGYCYNRFRELFGDDDADDIVWIASSQTMNPLLPDSVIEKALRDDPQRARAEFLSEWRSDLSDFVPGDVIEEATDYGVAERAPIDGVRYLAFADAAGGTGADSYALAIVHRERNGTVMIDAVREYKPPFVPAAVIRELAELVKFYGITTVRGDKWGGGFHSSEWQNHDIRFVPADRTTSDAYLATLPLLLAERVRLVDNDTLRRQLSGLERRVHGAGRESVSHAVNAHDDVAAAVCGAIAAIDYAARYRAPNAWHFGKGGVMTPVYRPDGTGLIHPMDAPRPWGSKPPKGWRFDHSSWK
jgi:hypothetical protein